MKEGQDKGRDSAINSYNNSSADTNDNINNNETQKVFDGKEIRKQKTILKYRINLLKQDYLRKYRKMHLDFLQGTGLGAVPVISLMEAFSRPYSGDAPKIISRSQDIKHKISIKVGDRDISIGEYDSDVDGSVMSFVKQKILAKKNRGKK
ncbi:hypothetical protein ENBRE01_0578 [Enteropsectra breve]|nr:hypothetical protein ENBRE01_0578 [Enteropsectra breve]